MNPIDSNGDGKVNDFASSIGDRTGNAFNYDRSLTNLCVIPCRVQITPATPAMRSMLVGKVTTSLPQISNAGFTSTLSWDHSVSGDASTGSLVYNTTSALWEATATYTGLPGVPSNSCGRVPQGLHDLLYGSRTATVTVQNPSGGSLCSNSTKYEVYFGDSLMINWINMAETSLNYSNHIAALLGTNALNREIFDKMNCSIETFSFADDTKAAQNFAMRRNAVANNRNNPFNQILRAALDVLARVSTNAHLAAMARTHLLSFEDADAITVTENTFARLHHTRNTERYHRAIQLAKLIILNYSPDVRSGCEDVLAILFDMNTLFERYVFAHLKRYEASHPTRAIHFKPQAHKTFWTAEQMRKSIRPDIVAELGSGPTRERMILDTKWKIPWDGRPADADLHQMHSYNVQFGASRSYLVYPRVSDMGSQRPNRRTNWICRPRKGPTVAR